MASEIDRFEGSCCRRAVRGKNSTSRTRCSRENLWVLVRPATGADAGVIASILSAFVSTTTIEWTDTPYTQDSILAWLAEHETVLVAEDEGDVVGVAA